MLAATAVALLAAGAVRLADPDGVYRARAARAASHGVQALKDAAAAAATSAAAAVLLAVEREKARAAAKEHRLRLALEPMAWRSDPTPPVTPNAVTRFPSASDALWVLSQSPPGSLALIGPASSAQLAELAAFAATAPRGLAFLACSTHEEDWTGGQPPRLWSSNCFASVSLPAEAGRAPHRPCPAASWRHMVVLEHDLGFASACARATARCP